MTEDASRQTNHAGAPDWDTIARYLAGESPAEEAERVSRWLDAHPGDKALVAQLHVSAVVGPADVNIEAALTRVRSRMGETGNARPSLTVERGGGRSSRTLFIGTAVAAAAAAIAAVATLDRNRQPATEPPPSARVYSTATGRRDSVRLSDGSRVILGPESRLTVPGDFGSQGRSVALEGDAYFDVVHNAAKPFVVRVSNAVIEDVGTTFTVETDPGNITTVSVMSGVVRLLPATGTGPAPATGVSGATLSAGDRGIVTADGAIQAQKKVVVADDSAWTAGRLVFRDASLTRVIAEVRRWYGLRIGIADSSLLRQSVNTTLKANQPVSEVLEVLSLMLGARVERQGDSATFHAGRGSNTVR